MCSNFRFFSFIHDILILSQTCIYSFYPTSVCDLDLTMRYVSFSGAWIGLFMDQSVNTIPIKKQKENRYWTWLVIEGDCGCVGVWELRQIMLLSRTWYRKQIVALPKWTSLLFLQRIKIVMPCLWIDYRDDAQIVDKSLFA